jgi:hypothetical protein
MDPAGRRLKIPVWMLLPECTEIKISQQPHLGKEALLSLASLIASQLDSEAPVHDNLLARCAAPPPLRSPARRSRSATASAACSPPPARSSCRTNRHTREKGPQRPNDIHIADYARTDMSTPAADLNARNDAIDRTVILSQKIREIVLYYARRSDRIETIILIIRGVSS